MEFLSRKLEQDQDSARQGKGRGYNGQRSATLGDDTIILCLFSNLLKTCKISLSSNSSQRWLQRMVISFYAFRQFLFIPAYQIFLISC